MPRSKVLGAHQRVANGCQDGRISDSECPALAVPHNHSCALRDLEHSRNHRQDDVKHHDMCSHGRCFEGEAAVASRHCRSGQGTNGSKAAGASRSHGGEVSPQLPAGGQLPQASHVHHHRWRLDALPTTRTSWRSIDGWPENKCTCTRLGSVSSIEDFKIL